MVLLTERYLGEWFEVEKYYSFLEDGGSCNAAVHSLNDNGTVQILFNEVKAGQPVTTAGTLTSTWATGEPKYNLNIVNQYVNVDVPYWILETDYNTYSVVWSCVDMGDIPVSAKWVYIMTRERNPSQDTVNQALAVLDRLGLDKTALTETDQTNCPSVH